MKQVYCIMIVFSMMILLPQYSASEGPVTAVLSSGPDRTAGVSGFGPNAIECLAGSYTAGSGKIRVFAVKEPLLFGDAWTKIKQGKITLYKTKAEDGRLIWAVERNVLMRDELKSFSRWYFISEFEAGTDESFCSGFLLIFADRTDFFFSIARFLADLSFPASITVTGK